MGLAYELLWGLEGLGLADWGPLLEGLLGARKVHKVALCSPEHLKHECLKEQPEQARPR
mgnify:CR=1 FL=1